MTAYRIALLNLVRTILLGFVNAYSYHRYPPLTHDCMCVALARRSELHAGLYAAVCLHVQFETTQPECAVGFVRHEDVHGCTRAHGTLAQPTSKRCWCT